MLMKAAKAENLVDGWQPNTPIYFYHASADECVPVACTHDVREAWGHLPNVRIEIDDTPAGEIANGMVHAYSGEVFHKKCLLDF